MQPPAAMLLRAVSTLQRGADGTVVACDGDGGAVACELVPGFADALRLARAGEPARVIATRAGAPPRALAVIAVPDRDDLALGIDEGALERVLAGTVENLVNQIAHDVRNHAFTIGLQSEMGARRSTAAPEVRSHFEAVLRQVDALKHYLEQLLLFGRPAVIRVAAVDPVAMAREQVQRHLFGRDASLPPATIRVEADGAVPQARWDAERLGLALQALIDNAVRSATPPPPVVVTIRATPEAAVIEVRDSGPGIPPDVLARLSVPMSVRRAGGAGLGLAIARKMAEAHRGRLELESCAGGTAARLIVPWEAASG